MFKENLIKNFSFQHNKKNLITKINLLRDNNLDSDYISEISYDLLGLIQSDQIVIDIK